jgi:ABC-type multidrug transport system ATPase subunit
MTVLHVRELSHGPIQGLSAAWSAGVHGVCGDEACGKTTLLRLLAGEVQPTAGQVSRPEGGVFWVDLQGAEHDDATVPACWDALRAQHPRWSTDLLQDLAEALDLTQHLDKRLHMLSAGSRRKVMVAAALASGATVTLLDQPFAALDWRSIRVIQGFLQEAAEHTSRAWIVADHHMPDGVRWASVLNLGEPR